jgi:hypothetical protein
VTVSPLTTTVLNAVPEHQTGIASGINNAVASVASLLLISTLGTFGLSVYHHALDRHLQSQLATIEMFRSVMSIVTVLCFASAGVAAITIRDVPLPSRARESPRAA